MKIYLLLRLGMSQGEKKKNITGSFPPTEKAQKESTSWVFAHPGHIEREGGGRRKVRRPSKLLATQGFVSLLLLLVCPMLRSAASNLQLIRGRPRPRARGQHPKQFQTLILSLALCPFRLPSPGESETFKSLACFLLPQVPSTTTVGAILLD